jgi:hypothetical protein
MPLDALSPAGWCQLGSVEIQDSSLGLFMIQALNGAIRSD